MGNRDIR